MKELFGQRLREQRIKHGLTLEQLAEKSELSSNYIGMVERGLKEPGLATIVKLLNALNISADTLLCDLVLSASHVTDDEIRKRLDGLTPIQKKAALDLLALSVFLALQILYGGKPHAHHDCGLLLMWTKRFFRLPPQHGGIYGIAVPHSANWCPQSIWKVI